MEPTPPLGSGSPATAPRRPGPAGGPPREAALRVAEDLFVIPDGDGFLPYAPHLRTVLRVDAPAVAAGKANGVEVRYSGARPSTVTNAFCKAATGSSFAVTPDGAVTSCYEVMAGDCPARLASAGDAWDASGNPRCHVNRELTRDQLRQWLSPAAATSEGGARP